MNRLPSAIPEEVAYLVEWAQLLHGRSGASIGGLLPLSPLVLQAWAEMEGVAPLHSLEIEALYAMDAAMFYFEDEPAEKDGVKLPAAPVTRVRRSWPKRKA